MPYTYCFSCGKLRDTQGGICAQCTEDMRLSKQGHGDTKQQARDNLLIDLDDGYHDQGKPKTQQ